MKLPYWRYYYWRAIGAVSNVLCRHHLNQTHKLFAHSRRLHGTAHG